MTKTFLSAIAAAAVLAGIAAFNAAPAQASDGIAGDYFAIGGCFQSRSAANKRARQAGRGSGAHRRLSELQSGLVVRGARAIHS
jgi:hypothetical protein